MMAALGWLTVSQWKHTRDYMTTKARISTAVKALSGAQLSGGAWEEMHGAQRVRGEPGKTAQ